MHFVSWFPLIVHLYLFMYLVSMDGYIVPVLGFKISIDYYIIPVYGFIISINYYIYCTCIWFHDLHKLLYCTCIWFHGFNGWLYCTCFRQTMDVLQTDIIFFVDKVKSSIIVASNQFTKFLKQRQSCININNNVYFTILSRYISPLYVVSFHHCRQ